MKKWETVYALSCVVWEEFLTPVYRVFWNWQNFCSQMFSVEIFEMFKLM